jgi:hypothetical protein
MIPERILNLKREMISQDNLATSHPLYCVFEKERIFGIDPAYGEKFVWLHHDDLDSPIDENEVDFDAAGKPINESIEKYYFVERDRFVNAHFTMKAAKDFITANKHNHPTAFVFVISLYGCHEMIALQEWIKGL